MLYNFSKDHYPGKPRILFIANAFSSHTLAWIDLLKDQQMNVRLFSLPDTIPPVEWQVHSYISTRHWGRFNVQNRRVLYTFPNGLKKNRLTRMWVDFFDRFLREYHFPEFWLSRIIKRWEPDVIHTLGLDPAAYLLIDTLNRFPQSVKGKWVVTVRGGPDLALNRFLPKHAEKIKEVFARCNQVIADNELNYKFAQNLGLEDSKICPLGPVPGTGGIKVDGLSNLQLLPPSQRERIVLWPKGYESNQSKALPVFEAIKTAWPAIQPCKVIITAVVQDEVRVWFEALPDEIKNHCILLGRIPRKELLQLISTSRVVLSPSISDGVPNLLYESMASGAFPIFSPLETIKQVVHDPINGFFANNLYPDEISAALVRAMSDDSLIDEVSSHNREFVSKVANRNVIQHEVVEFYRKLSG